MKVVQGGDDGWIFGGAQDYTAWASGTGETELEKLGHAGRATDVLHGLPSQGRPAELPGGRMPGTSGDEDDNVRVLTAPACP